MPVNRLTLENFNKKEEGVSINNIFSYDDHIGLVGLSDGTLRVITLYPLADAGVVGEHYDGGLPPGAEDHSPVESFAINYNFDTVATIGDNSVVQVMPLKGELIEAASLARRAQFKTARVNCRKILTENEKEMASEILGKGSGFFKDL